MAGNGRKCQFVGIADSCFWLVSAQAGKGSFLAMSRVHAPGHFLPSATVRSCVERDMA
jgi:hypothetical protein